MTHLAQSRARGISSWPPRRLAGWAGGVRAVDEDKQGKANNPPLRLPPRPKTSHGEEHDPFEMRSKPWDQVSNGLTEQSGLAMNHHRQADRLAYLHPARQRDALLAGRLSRTF